MNQIDKLFDSIKKISKEKTKAYDTQATVTRVDGGTVYVHIPGGVDETPIEKTINANPGDIVQIRVANGRAWATGNASAPPTDDKVANIANNTATNAKQTAGVAQKTAGVAKDIADAAAADLREQKEYFWHDDAGAHVLSDTERVSGKRYRTDLKGAGQEIFEIDGQNETSVAKFGASGARIGPASKSNVLINASGQRFYGDDGSTVLANIGYISSSGLAYFTFGRRATGSSNGAYSFTEGDANTASARCSHAEGALTTASGIHSHAEGSGTTASGGASHAEGSGTTASGTYSHVEGALTEASGFYSHAGGYHTKATKNSQTVIGEWNEIDEETSWSNQKWFIIGDGTSETSRRNAFSVSHGGNVKARGTITDGNGNSIPEIDHGLTAGVQTNANSYKDLMVTFNKTFSSVPTVVCSLYSTATAGALGSVSVSAINITTTGFTARVFNAGSSSRTPAVSWIAIS